MTQEEKLEEAKRLYETANADQKYVLESLFPELAESEDEKIRKEIIYHIQNCDDTIDEETGKRMLDWLEKQGEITKEWSEMKINTIQAELQDMVDLKHKTEQGEQKPAWSEEDETITSALSQLLKDCELENNWNCVYSNDREVFFVDMENWLNSLRPQNRWKPSDEQMKAVEVSIRLCPDTEKGNYFEGVLEDLLEQLKKL